MPYHHNSRCTVRYFERRDPSPHPRPAKNAPINGRGEMTQRPATRHSNLCPVGYNADGGDERPVMVMRGGEDRESKSFSKAAGKKAPRVAWCDDPVRHSILFPINLALVGGIGGLLLQG
jgi:hypothetical protein